MAAASQACELEHVSAKAVRLFSSRRLTLGTAESLTGGMIAAAVASVPGASSVLMGGIVSYDPRVKRDLLGVPQEIIDGVGVVSEPCARQMAVGARAALKTDVAVSATGIAGPAGGTPKTPVGTVFIGVSGPNGTQVEKCLFEGDRQSVRAQSARRALEMAINYLTRVYPAKS